MSNERDPRVDPQIGDRVQMAEAFPVPKVYQGRILEVRDLSHKSLSGRRVHKVCIGVVRRDGIIGKLGGCFLISTWRKWHQVTADGQTAKPQPLPKLSGRQIGRAGRKNTKKTKVTKSYPKPTLEELSEENRQISEATDRFHEEMKDAKVLGVPMTPLMGFASAFLGLMLPSGSPERRRAMNGAMSLLTHHTMSHLAEGGKLAEGLPKVTKEPDRLGRPHLFETMFKKKPPESGDNEKPEPQ